MGPELAPQNLNKKPEDITIVPFSEESVARIAQQRIIDRTNELNQFYVPQQTETVAPTAEKPNFISPPVFNLNAVIDTGPKFDSPVPSAEHPADYPPVDAGQKNFTVINAQPPLK